MLAIFLHMVDSSNRTSINGFFLLIRIFWRNKEREVWVLNSRPEEIKDHKGPEAGLIRAVNECLQTLCKVG